MNLPHPIRVDDDAAVNPDELCRIEPPLDLIHRLPHQIFVRPRVNVDVIVSRFDPIDLRSCQEMDSTF